MKILVTGATGLVGTALAAALAREGHTVCRLVRSQTKSVGGTAGTFDVPWDPETGELGGAAVGAEAVVNLGGASIADGRWTDSRKKLLRTSRVDATRALVTALGKNSRQAGCTGKCIRGGLLRQPRRRNPDGGKRSRK